MEFYGGEDNQFDRSDRTSLNGRFPANLLVEDDVLNESSYSRYFSLDNWWSKRIDELPENIRKTFPFIICPKSSKSEKNKGLEDMEDKQIKVDGGSRTYNARCKNCGKKFIGPKNTICHCDNPETDETVFKMKNNHPTCKPLKLMSYLITLGSREGDTVLDPFMGSGTTGIGCKLLQRNFIGMELDEGYYEISKKRIEQNEN